MALTLIGKAILGTTAGVAIITPTTYFALRSVTTTHESDFDSMSRNCASYTIKKGEKAKIVACKPTGGGSSPLTFYLQEGDIDPATFNKSSLKVINSLAWKKKTDGGDKDYEMHITFSEGEKSIKKIDGDTEIFPNQNIEEMEKKCTSLDKTTLNCPETSHQISGSLFFFPPVSG